MENNYRSSPVFSNYVSREIVSTINLKNEIIYFKKNELVKFNILDHLQIKISIK